MKYLTLIRHAKSSWKHPELNDYDRPLNKRGKRDLPGLVERATRYLPAADELFYSPARRTFLTQEPLVLAWQLDKSQCQAAPLAYEASATTLLSLLQTEGNSQHRVLVGHNPGLQDLIALLTGEALPGFPTAAFAHISLNIDNWCQLQPESGKLLQLDYPKMHRKESDETEEY